MRIRSQLILLLLGVGSASLLVPSYLAYKRAEQALRTGVADQLVSLRETKARHIEAYMEGARKNVELIAADPKTIEALQGFRSALGDVPSAAVNDELEAYFYEVLGDWDEALDSLPSSGKLLRLQELYGSSNPYPSLQKEELFDAKDGSSYSRVHAKYHGYFKLARQTFGFRDILILDAKSGISVYSVRKQADFATDFLRGPFRNMNGAEAVRGALSGRTRFADFENYLPNRGLPTAFAAAPIKVNGAVEGVVLVLLPINEITSVMTGGMKWEQEGLGKTGETFLVGPDMTMRSDSRFLTEDAEGLYKDLRLMGATKEEIATIAEKHTTVLAFKLKSEAAHRALAGRPGSGEVMGYRGHKIVAAYGAVSIPDLRWGIVSKREVTEAFAPLGDIARNSVLTFLGLFAVVLAVAVIATRTMVRPLEVLADAARRFGKGDKGVRVELDRRDEIGDMAAAFNTMVEETGRMDKISDGIRRNIVHDLKTPVTVVKGMGETLLVPEIASDPVLREEMASAIVDQSDRLLDDLRDILAPIDDSYIPEVQEFDLSLVVEQVVKAERHTGRSGKHELIVEGTDTPHVVVADRRKIRRVVENLLSNAVKYSPGEGKQVWIRVKFNETGMALISVEDQGLGMTTDELYKVLTDGGRVADHMFYGIEGTGFGLGSVRLILAAHKGQLVARSVKGEGSLFTAIFPIHPPQEAS